MKKFNIRKVIVIRKFVWLIITHLTFWYETIKGGGVLRLMTTQERTAAKIKFSEAWRRTLGAYYAVANLSVCVLDCEHPNVYDL